MISLSQPKKRRSIIQAVDEKSRSKFNDLVHSLLNKEYVDDLTYIKELTKVLLAHIYQGNVVIVGRGANFISPFENGLHVNVVAPQELRIQRTMEYDHLSHAQAKELIKKYTTSREQFIKQYFRKDATKAINFDVSINTRCYTIKAAARMVIEAFYQKFPPPVRYKALLTK